MQFLGHEVLGDAVDLALRYRDEGADELVLYDITASSEGRTVDYNWVRDIARALDIPFCVAGGIRSAEQAVKCLNSGADKVSINSPALERPDLINELADMAGSQCVVVGIDSREQDDDYIVHQYSGDPDRMRTVGRRTLDWVVEAKDRGAGEIVLNCMNQDGVRKGYDLKQLRLVRDLIDIPLVASGGAGAASHFVDVFAQCDVSGAPGRQRLSQENHCHSRPEARPSRCWHCDADLNLKRPPPSRTSRDTSRAKAGEET